MISPEDVAAWLMASHTEEKHGVRDYEKLLARIKGAPEYSHIRSVLKKIIRDEKRHVKMLGSLYSER
jgi:rubrerythrin